MPSYFEDQLGFDVSSSGVLCVFPYLSLFVATLFFGNFFEYLQNERGWSVDSVRQTAEFVSLGGAAVGLIISGFIDEPYVAYVFVIITQVYIYIYYKVKSTFLSSNNYMYLCSLWWEQCSQVLVAHIVMSLRITRRRWTRLVICLARSQGLSDLWLSRHSLNRILVSGSFHRISSWLHNIISKQGVWGWRAFFFLSGVICVVALLFWMKFQTSAIVPELNTPAVLPEDQDEGRNTSSAKDKKFSEINKNDRDTTESY